MGTNKITLKQSLSGLLQPALTAGRWEGRCDAGSSKPIEILTGSGLIPYQQSFIRCFLEAGQRPHPEGSELLHRRCRVATAVIYGPQSPKYKVVLWRKRALNPMWRTRGILVNTLTHLIYTHGALATRPSFSDHDEDVCILVGNNCKWKCDTLQGSIDLIPNHQDLVVKGKEKNPVWRHRA